MKRIISAALALLLLCTGAWMRSASAEGEPQIVSVAVATVEGAKGDAVELPVSIDNCAGVDSFQCNLNYDAAALKIVSVTPGTVFPAEYCVTNVNEAGRVRVAAIDATGLSEGGDMLLLSCRVLADGGCAVTISEALVTTVDADYTQVKAYVSVTDGGIAAGGTLPAPAATPWIPETPPPTPSPTPEPTAQPEVVAVTDAPSDATPAPTFVPEPATASNLLPYIIVGVLSVLIAAAIVIVLVSSAGKKRRRKKRRKRKKTQRPAQ